MAALFAYLDPRVSCRGDSARYWRHACFVILFCALPVLATAQSSVAISPIFEAGDPAPVPPTLVTASSAKLNDAGDIVFVGDGGILLMRDGRLSVIAAPADP